jgi:hypothetical protein
VICRMVFGAWSRTLGKTAYRSVGVLTFR